MNEALTAGLHDEALTPYRSRLRAAMAIWSQSLKNVKVMEELGDVVRPSPVTGGSNNGKSVAKTRASLLEDASGG